MAALSHGIRSSLLIVITALTISACGDGSDDAPADTLPEEFSFDTLTNQEPGATLTSNTETISDINRRLDISIEGGEYSVNGEAFTNEDGSITNGQTLQLRATASTEYETSVTVTVTLGDNPAEEFVITTRAKDETPETFSFTAATNQELDTAVSSSAVTIAGIDSDTGISIENGSYSLDGGSTFTSEASTINADQEIIVRGTSSAEFETTTLVSLTVGTETEDFSITTRARDITPENLGVFTAVTAGDPSTAYISNALTVADIEGVVSISVSDGATYDIDESGVFTTEAGTVEAGQSVRIQATTSSSFDTPVVATLTVGTESREFSVTAQEDSTPDAFGLNETISEVEMDSEVSRGPLTITGINTAVAITIENGEYEIVGSGAGFVSTEGVINADDQINVRATAPSLANETLNVRVTVGTLTEALTIETLTDNTVPEVTVLFPPPASMTEGATVTIRGTATDEISDVSSVSISGGTSTVDATDTSDDGSFSTWEASITLAEGDNTLTVSVTDSANNSSGNAGSVQVRRDASLGVFPNGNEFIDRPTALAFLGNNEVVVADANQRDLIAVDLNTGERRVFVNDPNADNSNARVYGFFVDDLNGELFVPESDTSEILSVDIVSQAIQNLSDNDLIFGSFSLVFPSSFIEHPNLSGQVLIGDGNSIIQMDISDGMDRGVRSVFSAGSTDNGRVLAPESDTSNPFFEIRGLVYDADRELIFASDQEVGVYEVSVGVDASAGARRVISSDSVGGGINFSSASTSAFTGVGNLVLDNSRDRLLVLDLSSSRIISVSLLQEGVGDRSIFDESSDTGLGDNPLSFPSYLLYDENSGFSFMLVADTGRNGILAIDPQNGSRVYITKSSPPET